MSAKTNYPNKQSNILSRNYLPLRFIAVGGGNMLLGYLLFSATYFFLTPALKYAYIIASIIGFLIANFIAYHAHKYLVFQADGNNLKQYPRYFLVSVGALLLNIVLLAIGIDYYHLNAYLTQALATIIGVVVSYLGHHKFSFRVE